MNLRKVDMDVRQLSRLMNLAANGSLILLGSTTVLAGNRPHEQPTRPHMSAAYSANWGFNQTCWSRFPAVPGCPVAGCHSLPQGYENHPSQQAIYRPQNGLLLPDGQIIAPDDGFSQLPVSVFPDARPAAAAANSSGTAAILSPDQLPEPSAHQQFTPALPSEATPIPDTRSLRASPIPGASSGLPPLPSPPIPAPGQSLLQPSRNIGPNSVAGQSAMASMSTLNTGTRYGASSLSQLPMAATSFAGSRYGNAQPAEQMPAAPQPHISLQSFAGPYAPGAKSERPGMGGVAVSMLSQSRVLPNSAESSSRRADPETAPVYGTARLLLQSTELPPLSIYPRIPSERRSSQP